MLRRQSVQRRLSTRPKWNKLFFASYQRSLKWSRTWRCLCQTYWPVKNTSGTNLKRFEVCTRGDKMHMKSSKTEAVKERVYLHEWSISTCSIRCFEWGLNSNLSPSRHHAESATKELDGIRLLSNSKTFLNIDNQEQLFLRLSTSWVPFRITSSPPHPS